MRKGDPRMTGNTQQTTWCEAVKLKVNTGKNTAAIKAMFTAICCLFILVMLQVKRENLERQIGQLGEKQEKFLGQQQQEKSLNGSDSLRLESEQFRQKKKSLREVIPRKWWNCQVT